MCAGGAEKAHIALGSPGLSEGRRFGDGVGGRPANPATLVCFGADFGPGSQRARGGVAKNDDEFADTDLEILGAVCGLIWQRFHDVFDVGDALFQVDEDAGARETDMLNGVFPENAEYVGEAAATDQVGGKV